MRPLVLLLLLALLLALGAWWIGGAGRARAIDSGRSAPAVETLRADEARLEANTTAARQEEAVGKLAPVASSSRIRGRVVRGPHALPVAGIEVRCAKELPPQRFETGGLRLDALAIARKEGPLLVRVSGADGAFEFEGLERGALYTLDARGPGWLVQPLAGVAPAEDERLLAVQRIYTARLLAVGEDGKALESGCEYLRYARVAQPGECESVPVRDAPEGPLGEGPGRVYTFASDCDEARLGPFRVLVSCAGFEKQDFDFWAYPEGGADLTTLTLRRAAGAGSLRVLQDCGCAESACAHLLEGLVELQPADPAEKSRAFELSGLVREQLFEGIPAGTWRVRVQARAGGFVHPPAGEPPLEIVVGSDVALLHVPVGTLGALRWKLRGPGDELPRESVPLGWQVDGTDSHCALWMSVVMRGVEQGPQAFEIDADKVASLEGATGIVVGTKHRISVEISPGETKLVVVHTP